MVNLRLSPPFADLQILVDGVAVNSPNTSISADLVGATITLACISDGCLVDARLEWLDGAFPISDEGSLSNLELEMSENALSLYIRNFTVENYGQYHCRCVKEYSRNAIESPSNPLYYSKVTDRGKFSKIFCSDQDNVVNLLPYGRIVPDAMEHHFVAVIGEARQFNCTSGNWSVCKAQSSAPQYIHQQVSYRIEISNIADQAKVLCLDSYDTLHKIFYVGIEDHPQLPLQLIQPLTRDGSDSIVVDVTENVPVFCAFHFSVPSIKKIDFVVYRNGRQYNLPVGMTEWYNPHLDALLGVDNDGLRGTLEKGVGYLNWVDLRSGFGPFVGNENLANEWYWNSTYSCRVTRKWEADITVNFTIARPGECKSHTRIHIICTSWF